MTAMPPVLRYHDGKWGMTDRLLSHFPLASAYETYIQPFGGSDTRIELARRYGLTGVRSPEAGETSPCSFAALFAVSREVGEMMETRELIEQRVLRPRHWKPSVRFARGSAFGDPIDQLSGQDDDA